MRKFVLISQHILKLAPGGPDIRIALGRGENLRPTRNERRVRIPAVDPVVRCVTRLRSLSSLQ